MLEKTRYTVHAAAVALILAGVALVIPFAASAGEVASGVDLKFWGRAIFNMHYDTAIQYVDFMSYLTDDQTESLNFNPRDTRLGFRASQKSGDWTYSSVFEIDFYGDNAGNSLLPRLRLGYAEAKRDCGLSIRGGQDWVPVAQQNPGTIDFGVQSWSGNLWWRVPQLTARHRSGQREVLIGAMKHRISGDQERQEKMPWLMGRVGLFDLVGEGSLLALGGAWRSVTVDEQDYAPYLGAFEVVLPFGDSGVVLNGEAYYGAGVGREFVHYGFDYNPGHPDGATEIKSLGGFASLKVPASQRIDLNVGFGLDDPDDDDLVVPVVEDDDSGYLDTAPYLKNTSIFGNFKYKVTSNFGWGLEVAHFITDTPGGELTGQRFTGSWWFVF
jgi:hypothetical protein